MNGATLLNTALQAQAGRILELISNNRLRILCTKYQISAIPPQCGAGILTNHITGALLGDFMH